ncbi:MAG TPA: cytidylate kinase-like family protein [Solirubrobacteraceae bacterium]|nr:cytidylate kinase-like family protein [Solirubrobacteraceae bacterium]
MTLVALSGAYGAGGSHVGPALAERLGVPFLDRAIPAAVAEALNVPLDDAAAHDEQARTSWLERLLAGFVGQDVGAPVALPAQSASPEDFRRATEDVLRAQIATGDGVLLGRGSAILLREDPCALRVRLDGPPEQRVRQAMRLQHVDEDTARRRMRSQDRTHLAYAKHFYGVDLCDPRLYHVVLDSTAIDLEACVEMLLAAVHSLRRHAAPAPGA